MSFSSEQKNHIINYNYKSACCRKALLCGLLFSKGRLCDITVTISLEKNETAEFAAKLVREFYGADAEISRLKSGGRCVKLSFASKSAAKYLSEMNDNAGLFTEKCANCQSAFLRGVFLGAGRATNPEIQHSIEFTLGERADVFAHYLSGLGFSPKLSDKKCGRTVYFKNSSSIEDFYAYSGMNPAMFAVIEAKFSAEARKNIMRLTNCETNNIKKAVDAAAKQNELILKLEKNNLISFLPEELAETAMLRLRYPDLSLSQLAAMSKSVISKPGLSHRLNKIMEIGEKLLESHNK